MNDLYLPPNSIIHGNSVVLGQTGIVIVGDAGSGKSSLSHHLVRDRALAGEFARIVADDQVTLTIRSGRLIARPVPTIVGQSEIFYLGVVETPYQPCAVIDHFVELRPSDQLDRMPEPAVVTVTCAQSGHAVQLPCMAVPSQTVVIAKQLIEHHVEGFVVSA